MRSSSRKTRAGFTLVEVLVVILIIAALVTLLVAGVARVLARVPQVQTRAEIGQMDVAIQMFEQEFNVPYIPSYLVLREGGAYDLSDPNSAETKSYNYLRRVFGKHLQRAVDWNGDGVVGTGRVVLEGQHALVFFLGGIPVTDPTTGVNACTGFSTSPVNPAQPGGTRRGPFFQGFESKRLIRDPANGFFVYQHPYKPQRVGDVRQPYAYFSAYGVQNGYGGAWGGGTGDCPSLLTPSPKGPVHLLPYMNGDPSLPTYPNANTHQIVSAGRDNLFGSGGLWNPQGGGNPKDPSFPAGNDNLANFTAGVLEAPQ